MLSHKNIRSASAVVFSVSCVIGCIEYYKETKRQRLLLQIKLTKHELERRIIDAKLNSKNT